MLPADPTTLFYEERIPSPSALISEIPMHAMQQGFVKKSRNDIKNILNNGDQRLLLIVGPCSIHNINTAKEYALKLKQLSKEVSDQFYIVMRVYFEKARTALGWKGLMYDPWLNGTENLTEGLRVTRHLLRDLIDIGIPAASEFLDPNAAHYFGDLISWGCIGARTASSQTHRQMASGLSMPVGFKNSTDGNIDIAINGILSASRQQSFMSINNMGQLCMVRTSGNSQGHLVLRGGEEQPNYDPQSISYALKKLKSLHLPLRLMIDCAHDNCFRQHEKQIPVFQSVIGQVLEGNNNIKGLLLESHLEAGNQSFHRETTELKETISITDPCLGWNDTERLISWAHHLMTKNLMPAYNRTYVNLNA